MELQDKEVFKQKESDQTDLCISSDSSKHGKEEGNVPIEVEIGAKQEDAETGFERNHSVRRCFNPQHRFCQNRPWIFASLIVLMGGASCAAFLSLGLLDESRSSDVRFQQTAVEMTNSLLSAWEKYEIFGLWVHQSCSKLPSSRPEANQTLFETLGVCRHDELRYLYEQITSVGIGLYSLQFASMVQHQYREAIEQEFKEFLSEYSPATNFTGLTHRVGQGTLPQKEKEVYAPIFHAEPLATNAQVIGMDTIDNPFQQQALENLTPVLSGGINLIQDNDPDVYSVYLLHPGANSSMGDRPRKISVVVFRIPDLLTHTVMNSARSLSVYLYDSTEDQDMPQFLGGLKVCLCPTCPHGQNMQSVPETAYGNVPRTYTQFEMALPILDREWVVVIMPLDDTMDVSKLLTLKSKAEEEKSAMALNQVLRERSLNEYMAHEVRNPLASAMAALSFVSVNTREKVQDKETCSLLLDDIRTTEGSLSYINDLLRSMLDMNKAAGGQIKIHKAPTDIRKDVLEPTAAILHMRGAAVDIQVQGSSDVIVSTDSLRLKQIILNLSINASKFVEKGFIRLRLEIVEGHVRIHVEDSGPGVPPEKRAGLFEAFQESLDLLSQGTGIGLSICRHLATLMNAMIWLDDTYHSGVPGCPGARFVVDLQKTSMTEDMMVSGAMLEEIGTTLQTHYDCVGDDSVEEELPESLNVLFVDDEAILRKLFIRSVKRISPDWNISEAGNVDAALRMVQENDFDMIFLDQYMPSTGRPILGTEAVREMRAIGVSCTICGLSANDQAAEFMKAGADGFIMKPFPCNKRRLKKEMLRLLLHGRRVISVSS